MKERILGYDVARALAILGMMFVNYKIVFTYGKVESVELSYLISLLEGRAAAVFLILAGIGIGLLTKKMYESNDIKKKKNMKLTLIKRAIFLFVLGMILLIPFEWSADILHFYGFYMLFVTVVLFWNPKKLIFTSALVLLITVVLQLGLDYTTNWNAGFDSYSNLFTINAFMMNSFFNGYHPVMPWFSFIVIGLIVTRLKVLESNLINKTIITSLAVAISIEVISFVIIQAGSQSELLVFLFDTKPMNPSVLYILASSAWAICFIALCIKVSKKFYKSKVINILAITGKMALTHYVMHCVLVLITFSIVDGLAYKNELFVVILSLVVFLCMAVFSHIWGKKYDRGPLELLMRKVT